jgi:hypothetical protein
MRELKVSAAANVMVFMADSADHVTGKTGLTLTITANKDGAAFGSITPTVTERGSGWYNLALTSSHTDTLGDLAIHATGSGADPSDFVSRIVAVDKADAVRMGLTALPNAVAGANGGLPILSGTTLAYTVTTVTTTTTATNLTNLPTAPTDWISAAAVSAAAVTKVQSGLSTYAGTDTAGTTSLLARLTSTRAGYLDNLSAGAVALHADITGLSIPTTSQNAAAVWDLATSGHTTSGTFGAAMAAAGGTGDPWSTTIPGSYGAGTAGYILGNRAGFKLAADGVDLIVVETGVNARQSLAMIGAATAGKASGLSTATAVYYAMGPSGTSTVRITATTDSSGNRTATTLSLPA